MQGRLVFTLAICFLSGAVHAGNDSRFSSIDSALNSLPGKKTPITSLQQPTQQEPVFLPPTTVIQESLSTPLPGSTIQNTQQETSQAWVSQKSDPAKSTVLPMTPTATTVPSADTVMVWSSNSPKSGFVSGPGGAPNVVTSVNSIETLQTKFTEVPIGTVFEFSQDIEIPAHKSGIFFNSGKVNAAVEDPTGSDILKLMAGRSASSYSPDCALMSDRSNLRMKGSALHQQKTYLEVDKLQITQVENTPGRHALIAQVFFKEKVSKNANDAVVKVWLNCTIPNQLQIDAKSAYTLRHIQDAMGPVFIFKPANVAEI